MKHILLCQSCNTYTMKLICTCGKKTSPVKPPKFSPEDKYGDYRRKVLKPQLSKEGIL